MEKSFRVRSSDGVTSYLVSVEKTKNGIALYCDCPAGNLEKLCKHKLAIVTGDEKILFNPGEKDSLKQICEWIGQSQYPQLMRDLHDSEKVERDAKHRVALAKKRLESAMKEGA